MDMEEEWWKFVWIGIVILLINTKSVINLQLINAIAVLVYYYYQLLFFSPSTELLYRSIYWTLPFVVHLMNGFVIFIAPANI